MDSSPPVTRRVALTFALAMMVTLVVLQLQVMMLRGGWEGAAVLEGNITHKKSVIAAPATPFFSEDLLVFIHVGKTGGSSARCMLSRSLRETLCKENTDFEPPAIGDTPTAVSQKVVGVCHMGVCKVAAEYESYIYDEGVTKASVFAGQNFPGAILSVRNPVDRLISWFYYEQKIWVRDNKEKKQGREIFGCYDSFPELAREVARQYNDDQDDYDDDEDKNFRITKNCRLLAARCITGEQGCEQHNKANYEYYLRPSLPPDFKLYVIRNEFKWEDFYTVNLMLGGSAGSYHPNAVKVSEVELGSNGRIAEGAAACERVPPKEGT